jgi:hypothetical protein
MDIIEEIKKLAALLKDGAITQEEFNSLKKDIIGSSDHSPKLALTKTDKNPRNDIPSQIEEIISRKSIEKISQKNFATYKRRKNLKKILIPIIIIGLFWGIIILLSHTSSTSSNSSSCAGSDAYKDGYSHGSLCRSLGGSTDCSTYVEKHNEETGRNTLQASDCFCEGFNDGISGISEK